MLIARTESDRDGEQVKRVGDVPLLLLDDKWISDCCAKDDWWSLCDDTGAISSRAFNDDRG
jgi:hypothetical protein